MASSFQQRARLRKAVYAGLILVLFTISYLYRQNIVLAQADDLGLREESKGEVELTGSAVRLSLTGTKGFAVCFLWLMARDKMARREYNEMEMLVNSVAKLQPHFISPWLFQSWNIAFNVVAQVDSARDKYFYIARGTQLLAEGERRNRGSSNPEARIYFPGSPDLRYHLGFYYQLKIGKSDEAKVLRCLYQLSCMPPAERDPKALEVGDGRGGRKVDPRRLESFCVKHPRLVRRLREDLGYDTPESLVVFLKENRDLPARYDPNTGRLKEDARDRYPILPPSFNAEVPFDNDEGRGSSLGDEFDTFGASRAWYQFAMEPLPPLDPDIEAEGRDVNQSRYRLPRMLHYIFRQYPAIAQENIAEGLAQEGWFDRDGWRIESRGFKPIWFSDAAGNERVLTVARNDPKYTSARAWELAYQAYLDFGRRTQLLMEDLPEGDPLRQRFDRLSKSAQHYQDLLAKHRARRLADLPPGLRTPEARAGELAVAILGNMRQYRGLTNVRNHYYQAEAERGARAVAARKHYFLADKLWKEGSHDQSLALYEKWLTEWKQLLQEKEKFCADGNIQEESYEGQLRYFRRFQEHHKRRLKAVFIGLAGSAVGLPLDGMLTRDQKDRIIPAKNIRGPLDEPGFFQPSTVSMVRERVMYPNRARKPAAAANTPPAGARPVMNPPGR